MKFVCVTGMHRSGTSLAAAVTNFLGVDFGDPGQMAGALPDNPKGFWENEPIRAINDSILASFGGTWYDPPVMPTGWERAGHLDQLRRQAGALIERTFGSTAMAGCKDPRISLTLPFWRTLIPIDAAILCIRHPGEVAGSLMARNGIDSEMAAGLWLRYTVDAWVNHPSSLICLYPRLLDSPGAAFRAIAEYLGLPAPSGEQVRRLTALVDPALRHHSGPTSAGGPRMRLAVAIFRLIEQAGAEVALPVLEVLRQSRSPAPGADDLQAAGAGSALETRQLLLIGDWARNVPVASRAWLLLPRRWGLLSRAIRKRIDRLAQR